MLDKVLKVGVSQLCCHAYFTWGVVHPMLDYHGKCSWSRGVTEATLRKDMQQANTAYVPCLHPCTACCRIVHDNHVLLNP